MHLFIDEAGQFIPGDVPGIPAYSLVLALIIPSAAYRQLSYEFLRIRDRWPQNSIEVKGSKLGEAQCSEVAHVLTDHDAVIEMQIIDMGQHDKACIEDFKARQAKAVTENLTPEHRPETIEYLARIANRFRAISNQLFVQAYLTMEVVMNASEVGTSYYVQRSPPELANYTWVIDRKDRAITDMEDLWSKFILPAAEFRFMKSPFPGLDWCDYSHAKFQVAEKAAKGNSWRRKSEWLTKAYKLDQDPDKLELCDLRELLTTDQKFEDSRNDLGLQLADIAATSIRRALKGNLQKSGWEPFGRLIIKQETSAFVALGTAAKKATADRHATRVWNQLEAQSKNMVL